MKFVIKHEIKGRMRIHVSQYRMSYEQADTLLYFLHSNKYVTFAKVYERTGDAVISYVGDRTEMIRTLQQFSYEKVDVPAGVVENSGRELNAKYQEKLIGKIVCRYAGRMFLPYPLRACVTTVKSVKYLWKGLQCLWQRKIEVPVLDATAIGVSIFRNDIETAGSVMFLLGIGELLEEWTHKKSVDDLARTMSLNVGKVWLKRENQEVLVPASEIRPGDEVVVHMGNVIPFDGIVSDGEAMVNQALWKEDIRECKILAGILQPVDTFFPEIADIWVENMPNIEIAELTCMNLFQNLPYAPAKSFHWIASEEEYAQVCGFLTIARLLVKKGDMAERPAGEFLDQAICAVLSGTYHVRNAALLAIRKYMQHSEEHAFQVCRLVESMKDSTVEAEQILYNMVAEEAE